MAKIYVSSTCGWSGDSAVAGLCAGRVWPLNFVSAYLSAEHGEACVGIDISSDGQQVLCTCGDSSVELLDLANQQHLPISRAHPARVIHASINASMRELYTVCEDGLVRVWTIPDLQQVTRTRETRVRAVLVTLGRDGELCKGMRVTFEMQSPQDPPLRVAAHPTQRVLALGFKSGAVRVLAVEGPAVWMEANHHKHPVTGIWFVDLPSSAADAVTPCSHQQQPLQHRSVPSPGGNTACSHSASMCYLVVSLDASGSEPAPDGISALAFAADGSRAARYLSARKLGIISLPHFTFEQELNPLSTACRSVVITTFSFSAAADALCVCGSDSTMRLFRILRKVKLRFPLLPRGINTQTSHSVAQGLHRPRVAADTRELHQSSLWAVSSAPSCRLHSALLQGNSPCLLLSREVALLSGPISTAWISSAEDNSSIFPQVALTCGADNLLKALAGAIILDFFHLPDSQVWNMASVGGAERQTRTPQVGKSSVEWQEAMVANSAERAEQAGTNSQVSQAAADSPIAAGGLKPEFPEFQSFAGHHKPAFMLQLLGDYVLSISPTETIMWKVNSSMLSAAADVAPVPYSTASTPNQQMSSCAKLITEPTLHCRQRHTQQQLQQAQGSQSELPQGSPTQDSKQQSPRCESESHEYLDADSLDSPRTLSPPKRAPLPSIAAIYTAKQSARPSAPAHGDNDIHSNGLARSPETAEQKDPEVTVPLMPPAPATSKAPSKEAVTQSSAAHGMIAAGDAVSQRPASADARLAAKRSSPRRKVRGCKGEIKIRALADTPVAQVFPKTEECSALFNSNKAQEQSLAILDQNEVRDPQLHCLLHGAAARHVIGTSVTECRSSCFWRPSNGVLAHAVGNWIIVEKLAARSASQEGRCLGLLPALIEPKRSTMLRPEEASTAMSMRRTSSIQCLHRVLQQQQLQLLHQSAMLAHKPPSAVLSHPFVGRPIAFSLDTTARLAATISGGLDEGRLDVWRVSDFLSSPKCMSMNRADPTSPLDTSTLEANADSCICEGCCMRCRERGRPFEQLRGGPTPAVGADVGTPLKRLLSAASGEEREVVFVSPRSVTLWRVVRGESSPSKIRSK
ncbi:hypothetical protein Emag_001647 [Eimeria magna]